MENPPLKSAYTVDTQFSHKIKQNQGVEHGIYDPKNVATQTANASTMCSINACCPESTSASSHELRCCPLASISKSHSHHCADCI